MFSNRFVYINFIAIKYADRKYKCIKYIYNSKNFHRMIHPYNKDMDFIYTHTICLATVLRKRK